MDAFKDLQRANAELAGGGEPVVKNISAALQIDLFGSSGFGVAQLCAKVSGKPCPVTGTVRGTRYRGGPSRSGRFRHPHPAGHPSRPDGRNADARPVRTRLQPIAPAAKLKKVTRANLEGIALIMLGGASGNRRIVETQLAKAGLNLRGRFVVESTPSAIALARENVGGAILPAAMSATMVATGLIEVPLVDPVLYRTIALVRRRNETLTPAASALYAIAKAQLSTVRR
jgi:hypothetical protein